MTSGPGRRMVARLTSAALVALTAPVMASFAVPSPAAAQGFLSLRPTTTADIVDPNDGQLSLREAIDQTNASSDEAAVTLQRNAVYRLTRCSPSTAEDNRANALVHTAGRAGLTLNGNGATIQQTCSGAGVIVQRGDGLFNFVDIAVRGGHARGSGGAIRSDGGGEVRFTNSALSDNQAAGDGGGIAARGPVTVSGATVARNYAGGRGGAVFSGGPLVVVKSSVHSNFHAGGGALVGPSVTLLASTLARNIEPQVASPGALTAFASVLSGTEGPNCATGRPTVSLGRNYSAADLQNSCGLGRGPGDVVNGPMPGLTPSTGPKGLAVLAPAPGSALLDAIPSADCFPARVRPLVPPYSGGSSDQLGVRRPQGGACDIGAIERIRGSLRRHAGPARTPDDPFAPPFSPPPPGDFISLKPTTTADVVDPNDGKLSLREAFAMGEASGAEVAITLERRAVYRLERCAAPFLARDNATNELVHVNDRGFTVTGNGATIFQDCDGAGVFVQLGNGLFILHDMTIMGGRSTHAPGGGVYSAGIGELRMTNTVVRDNQTVAAGGGVAAFGDVNLSGATFTDNHSDERAGAVAALGNLLVVKSSVYANTAAIANGGLEGGRGVTLVYSTVVRNSQPQIETLGRFTTFGSVLVGPGGGQSCHALGGTSSLGYNLDVADQGNSCGVGAGPGDLVGGATGLALQEGPWATPVYGPAAGSRVVDAIPPAECFPARLRPLVPPFFDASSDQLGVRRPRGRACDIGAIERLQGTLQRPVTDVPRAQGITRQLPTPPGALVVTTEADVVDARDGVLSLREAMGAANAATRDSVIVLQNRVYRLARCLPPLLAADNEAGELTHTSHRNLTVLGNGATVVQTCDGAGVFLQYGDRSFVLSDLTVTGGRVTQTPGGGIFSAGTGEVRLVRSWITDNFTIAAGGGLTTYGDVVLLGTTVSDNHTPEFAGGIAGTRNMVAVNSSIYGNSAGLAFGGAGVHTGTMTLLHTTITGNTEPNIDAGKLVSFASVVSDPRQAVPPPPFPVPHGNCTLVQPTQSLGWNVESTDTCGFGAGPGDRTGLADPGLGAQVGDRPFLVPNSSSPLVDAIPSARCVPPNVQALVPAGYDVRLDQRGVRRPQGPGCDVGAVERKEG